MPENIYEQAKARFSEQELINLREAVVAIKRLEPSGSKLAEYWADISSSYSECARNRGPAVNRTALNSEGELLLAAHALA